MKEYKLNTENIKPYLGELRAGDRVLLSGTVYTARDAAHKRLFEMIKNGETLPFDLNGAAVYYAGPTPTPEGLAIGSCGPTTAGRMDKYTPLLLSHGLAVMIGKGDRSPEVKAAAKENGAVYLCAVGGAGAVAAKHITECEVIAFPDLGCESIKRLKFDNFPLFVGLDLHGGSIFK